MKFILNLCFIFQFLTGVALAQAINITTPINECVNMYLTQQIKDKNGVGVNPDRYYMWLYDNDTGTMLWPIDGVYTAVLPGSSFIVNIGPSGQRIVNNSKPNETHVISVSYEYGSDCSLPSKPECNWGTEQWVYQVKNLKYVDCGPSSLTPTYGPSPIPTPTVTATKTGTSTATATKTP